MPLMTDVDPADRGPETNENVSRGGGPATGATVGPVSRRMQVARALTFAGVVALAIVGVVIVVAHDRNQPERAAAAAITIKTVPVPPEILVPSTRPTGTGAPVTSLLPDGSRRLTSDQTQTSLEQAIRRSSGWVHKVLCLPRTGTLESGTAFECTAVTEPPIAEVPPSRVVVQVIGPDGAFVWHRNTVGVLRLAEIEAAADTSCTERLEAGLSYVATLIAEQWTADGPAGPNQPPCVLEYGQTAVDAVFARTLRP